MNTARTTVFATNATLTLSTLSPVRPTVSAPATRRHALLSVIRHRASLLLVLSLLGSSASYCVYALGHMAQ